MRLNLTKMIGGGAVAALASSVLIAAPASAAEPTPVDLGNFTTIGTSEFGESVQMAEHVLFAAATDAGIELWQSADTPASVEPLKDINPGGPGSAPSRFARVGNSAFFVATTALQGRELWKTNVTQAGTVLVKDIVPGTGSPSIDGLAALGNKVVFSADVAANGGDELWISDGTAAGTELLKDINPAGDSNPSGMTLFKGEIYFAADNGVDGTELWKTDGTPGGTVQVRDINDSGSASSSPTELTVAGDNLIFSAITQDDGRELWRTQGTGVSTIQLRDISAGGPSGVPRRFTVAGGTTYFAATTLANGEELWKTNGTPGGTGFVREIQSGAGSAAPSNFVALGSKVVFRAASTGDDSELWISDGTFAGTTMVKDIRPGANGSSPQRMVQNNGRILFSANDGSHGRELWLTDGTVGGTAMVKDINAGAGDSNPSPVGNVETSVLFRTSSGGSSKLWSIDTAGLGVVQSSAPTLVGVNKVGRTLTVNPGVWEAGAGLSYQWLRNGVPITGAKGVAYKLTVSDFHKPVSVRVTGAKDKEISSVRVSKAVAVGAGTQARRPVPKISGTAKVGKKLKARPGTHDSGVKRSYRWYRNGKAIKGSAAKKSSYKLRKADKGKRIAVKVTAKKTGYATVVKTSKKTKKVK